MPRSGWRRLRLTAPLALACGAAPTLIAAPAWAGPCADDIAALSKRVDAQGREAISASSSGQGDAAARGGQGMTGAAGEASPRPPQAAAQAGTGAEKAQAARVALDEARTRDGKDDAAGCREALDRATKALDTAP